MEKVKRYVATFDLYIYANNDEDAKESAKKMMERINEKDDCRAEILSIHETPFGEIGKARDVL